MSDLTRDQVAHIAALARLKLSESEMDAMTGDLDQILRYVEKLRELDTTGIEPTAHATPRATPLRPDQADVPLDSELAVFNAPVRDGTAFVVPKVIVEEQDG